jgi:hypothetical protein
VPGASKPSRLRHWHSTSYGARTKLEHKGSTQPILDVANAVMAQAADGFRKELFSDKPSFKIRHINELTADQSLGFAKTTR